LEVDPVDLMPYLVEGTNWIGVEVLFFGHGEGTWPYGKPGLLADFELDGFRLVTDENWECRIDRSMAPGTTKRWYLRSLQERWSGPNRARDWWVSTSEDGWMPAMTLETPPGKPALASPYVDYANDIWSVDSALMTMAPRSIPLVQEKVLEGELVGCHRVTWHRDPRDWFEFRVPGSFEIEACDKGEANTWTFDFKEGMVGFPMVEIEAAPGTDVYVLAQESVEAEGPWLDTSRYAWCQFRADMGLTAFEAFEYEALRFLQVHAVGGGQLRRVFVRRRSYPWPNEIVVKCGERILQRVFDAQVNTIRNAAIDTVVDGMGRERQQYSGDCSHLFHAIRLLHGDSAMSARFLRTFARGQTESGVFFDSWPAVDRLQRLWQKQLGLTTWGSLVDHSVGFCLDHWNHWMETGDLEPAREHWSALMRFVDFLQSILDEYGLIAVEGLDGAAVWIDHVAFTAQRDKQCALNLYAVLMLRALAELGEALGESYDSLRHFRDQLLTGSIAQFWSPEHLAFVNNLPWAEQDGGFRYDDRSLAHAVLDDLAPDGGDGCARLLSQPTDGVGMSYPANAIWRYWALAKVGRMDVVLDDLRTRWATMTSVVENNTLQEHWELRKGSLDILSHCPAAPLTMAVHGIVGLRPTQPGFAEYEIRPGLGDITSFSIELRLPIGLCTFSVEELDGRRWIRVVPPPMGQGVLVMADGLRHVLTAGQVKLVAA
jgi:hypothetical protein